MAAIRGGLEPDIVEDRYGWHGRDFVEYAVLAAVAYVRASAERREQSAPQFIDDLVTKLQLERQVEDAPADAN